MIHLFLVLLYLSQVVRGTSSNTTSTTCPPPDGVSYRSVWSILGTCGLTLLICVWRSIHVNVPSLGEEWYRTWRTKISFVLVSFFVPESVVADATKEWWEAGCKVREFRERGYEWSMTHSFFAEMGGFVYANRDDEGTFKLVTMDSLKFLELCEEDKIANPMIMVEDIKDKSKSDTLGKAILAVQLLYPAVCMAVLTLLLLLIWKDKPLRPERPHIFYSPQEVTQLQEMDLVKLSQKYWKSEPSCLYELMAWFGCRRKTPSNPNKQKPRLLKLQQLLEVEVAGFSVLSLLSFCVTGIIFGGLHLTAWNFDFATDAEKKAWRVASLILAGAPLAMIVFCLTLALRQRQESTRRSGGTRVYLGIALILLSRLILLGLMFASLRSMPCSAHRNVIWTLYVPHI